MGDSSVLDTDAFLMKGEQIPPRARWHGNPATEVAATPTTAAVAPPSAAAA